MPVCDLVSLSNLTRRPETQNKNYDGFVHYINGRLLLQECTAGNKSIPTKKIKCGITNKR